MKMKKKSPFIREANENAVGYRAAAALHCPCLLVLAEVARNPSPLPGALAFVVSPLATLVFKLCVVGDTGLKTG